MRLLGLLAGLVMGLAVMAPSAKATTITGSFNFSADTRSGPTDPVTGFFHYSFDRSQAYSNDTSIITNFTSNIAFSSPIYFTNIPGLGFYFTASPTGTFRAGENNFELTIKPNFDPVRFSYSQIGLPEVYTTLDVTLTRVTPVTPVGQTPIPGALVMLLTALVGLGGAGFMRRRATARGNNPAIA
jgi:hypothetical protein